MFIIMYNVYVQLKISEIFFLYAFFLLFAKICTAIVSIYERHFLILVPVFSVHVHYN